MIRLLVLLVASSLTLVACGGGGSGSSDDSTSVGATAGSGDESEGTSDATDADPVAEPALTVTGLVTDAPVVGADVAVAIGSLRFETAQPTGSDGSYAVDIASTDTDADALVRLEAVDPTGSVRLSARMSSLSSLAARATDGVASGVDVTNVTTALDVLVDAQPGDVDTVADLEAAFAGVDAGALLDVAAAIKLVVEGIGGVTLPAGVADTRALAAAIAAGDSTFLDDVATTNPGAFDEAVARLLTDGHATEAFEEDAGGVYASRDGALTFALLADGSATMQSAGEAPVALGAWWVSARGRLVLAHDGEGIVREELTQLVRAGEGVAAVREHAELGTYGAPEALAFEHVALGDAFVTQTAPGSYARGSEPGVHDVLLSDGSGYTIDAASGEQQAAFAWSVDNGSIDLYFDGGARIQMTNLAYADDGAMRVLRISRAPGGELTGIAIERVTYEASYVDAAVEGGDTAGLLAGNAYGEFGATPRLLDFAADGTLVATAQTEDAGAWTVDADGTIVVALAGGDERYTLLGTVGDDALDVERDGVASSWRRVVHADFESLVGAHAVYGASGDALGETIEIGFNNGGQRIVDGEAPAGFTWAIDASGRLVLDFGGNVVETLSFLAANGDNATDAIRVRTVNGAIESVDAISL
jgi:hypothetical protein